MPRKPINPDNPDLLRHYVACMFSTRDMEVINRVAAEYGMSKAAAVRLMMRAGAGKYDPFTPQPKDET